MYVLFWFSKFFKWRNEPRGGYLLKAKQLWVSFLFSRGLCFFHRKHMRRIRGGSKWETKLQNFPKIWEEIFILKGCWTLLFQTLPLYKCQRRRQGEDILPHHLGVWQTSFLKISSGYSEVLLGGGGSVRQQQHWEKRGRNIINIISVLLKMTGLLELWHIAVFILRLFNFWICLIL